MASDDDFDGASACFGITMTIIFFLVMWMAVCAGYWWAEHDIVEYGRTSNLINTRSVEKLTDLHRKPNKNVDYPTE